MFALMTNREIYQEYLQALRIIYSANETMVITDWVFEKVAGTTRADLIKNPGKIFNEDILIRLKNCLADLLLHQPVQYVLGEAWFYGMKFKANENVLIPRPETEELVELVIDSLKHQTVSNAEAVGSRQANRENISTDWDQEAKILDIGTGSGCIAIAVKKNFPATTMFAIDISKGALSVATENALHHQVDINFMEIDFLQEAYWPMLPMFDIVVSNPPYIPLQEKEKLALNVTGFEPPTALFVPDDAPLLFYEKIAAFGKLHLREKGIIYTEIHEDFGTASASVFKPFYNVEIKKDIFGKERMLKASLAGQS